MRSTSPLPRCNGAASPRTSSSFFPFETVDSLLTQVRESLPTWKRGPPSGSPCRAVPKRMRAQIRKLRVISSKPLDASSGPAPGCAGAAPAVSGWSCWRLRSIAQLCCESCAMHRLHRYADDFFDSHFFALRFAVGLQCPKFDSQTAMRYRVNYSLYIYIYIYIYIYLYLSLSLFISLSLNLSLSLSLSVSLSFLFYLQQARFSIRACPYR